MGAPLPGRAGAVLSGLVPPGPEFDRLFRSFEHTAFRLEVRDRYNSPSEREPFARFLETGAVDHAWRSAWLEQLRESRQEGRRWQRVRVVSIPLTEYSDWGLRSAAASNEAGDDIRYVARGDARDLPDYDFWLFDSKTVVKMHFEDDDRFVGFEVIDDPASVIQHNHWRDAAWHQAVTRDDFAAKHLDQR